mmetsp:Transcript_10687/g.25468  ORF Transcript_10687/g.25468 Transcript_10687/m.25468 type:complete len:224 (+) Transcript_10687:537-1208(+)
MASANSRWRQMDSSGMPFLSTKGLCRLGSGMGRADSRSTTRDRNLQQESGKSSTSFTHTKESSRMASFMAKERRSKSGTVMEGKDFTLELVHGSMRGSGEMMTCLVKESLRTREVGRCIKDHSRVENRMDRAPSKVVMDSTRRGLGRMVNSEKARSRCVGRMAESTRAGWSTLRWKGMGRWSGPMATSLKGISRKGCSRSTLFWSRGRASSGTWSSKKDSFRT